MKSHICSEGSVFKGDFKCGDPWNNSLGGIDLIWRILFLRQLPSRDCVNFCH